MKMKFSIIYVFLLIITLKSINLKDFDKELDALLKDSKLGLSDDSLKDSKTKSDNFLKGSSDLLKDLGSKSSLDDLLKGSPDDILKSLGSTEDLLKDIGPNKGKDFKKT